MRTANTAPAQTEVMAGSEMDKRVAVAVVVGKTKGGREVEEVEAEESPGAVEADGVAVTGAEDVTASNG